MTFVLCSYGFVEYASVEEAAAVWEREETITMDGSTLFIDYVSPKGKAMHLEKLQYCLC